MEKHDQDTWIRILKSDRDHSRHRLLDAYKRVDRDLQALRREKRAEARKAVKLSRARLIGEALEAGVSPALIRKELGLTRWSDWVAYRDARSR